MNWNDGEEQDAEDQRYREIVEALQIARKCGVPAECIEILERETGVTINDR